ncbi:MAG TPA: ADOP family duplicated permease [Vicinamibacterales bacterium]|nr:ADOP family duplicated permease [Vicinamibacterales bacterium]
MSTFAIWDDLRHAARGVRGMPIVAAVIIASLAVGIGVNTVVFSWTQALVLRPLPGVPAASEVHLIEARTETGGRPGVSWLEFEDLRRVMSPVARLAAFRMTGVNIGETARTERAYGLLVSDAYFEVLRLRPAAGRFFTEAETARGAGADVVIVSHEFWRDRLGRAPISTQTVRVSGRDLRVVGVTPDGFQGTVLGLQFDLWLPAVAAPALLAGSAELDSRSVRGYYVMGRLPSSIDVARASAAVASEMADLQARFPEANRGVTAEVLPFWRASRGPQGFLIQALALLQGVLLLLLLAVCGNTANLLLARASQRQREVGVRLAVGGGPWRVARLLLLETALMAVAGAVAGTVLAAWSARVTRAMPLITTAFPVRFDASLDGTTLAFAIGLALVATLAAGALPAFHLARLDPLAAVRGEGSLLGRARLRNWLMAAEVAVALVVLLVAGIFYRRFAETEAVDPGFRIEGVLLAAYDLGGQGRTDEDARRFAERFLAATAQLREVEAAAIASSVPLDIHGLPQRSFAVEGRPRLDGGRDRALSNIVTPGYFAVMRIPFLEGADFSPLGDRSAPREVIVNRAFRRRYVADGEVLGRGIESGDTYRIVGVVRDSTYDAFGEPAAPAIFFSYRDRPRMQGELHLRTRQGAEASLGPAVREIARELEPGLPLFGVRTLSDHVEMNLVIRRVPARLFVVLGPLLLALAACGMYAVVAYAVARRTREIGVRLALGGSARRVTRDIVQQTLRVIAAGAAAGWLAVYGVYIHLAPGQPVSWLVFAGTPAVLMGVAALSCWIPARRVSLIDPTLALRQE